MADSRSIGERLRAFDEHARQEKSADVIPENRPGNKEPAEGSRETVIGGGITNRPPSEEQRSQERVPPRGKTKDPGHETEDSRR